MEDAALYHTQFLSAYFFQFFKVAWASLQKREKLLPMSHLVRTAELELQRK
jgi:hypothetical protein